MCIDTVFSLFKLKIVCKNDEYNTHLLWSAVIRIIDILFVYEKNNFLSSCFEIKLKTKIYDSQERRYRYTFSYLELADWMGVDMMEHP